MNPLRAAFDTLVAGRDRLAVAVAALAPLLEGGLRGEQPTPAELVETAAPVKALKPGRKKRAAKVARKAAVHRRKASPAKPRPKAVKTAKATSSRPRLTPETIAKIQAMDGQGKTVKEIVAACGVSAPTVTKYANAAPVKLNGPKPEPVVASRTDPKTGRPWI